MEEHWDLEADRALQVSLAMGGANKPARYVVVFSDFGTPRFTLYELVSADVAPRVIIILLLLAGSQAIYCSICWEFCNYLCFPNDKNV